MSSTELSFLLLRCLGVLGVLGLLGDLTLGSLGGLGSLGAFGSLGLRGFLHKNTDNVNTSSETEGKKQNEAKQTQNLPRHFDFSRRSVHGHMQRRRWLFVFGKIEHAGVQRFSR